MQELKVGGHSTPTVELPFSLPSSRARDGLAAFASISFLSSSGSGCLGPHGAEAKAGRHLCSCSEGCLGLFWAWGCVYHILGWPGPISSVPTHIHLYCY